MKAKKYLWSIICVYFCYLTHGIQAIILSQNNVNFAKQWGFNMSDPQSAAYAAGLAAVSTAVAWTGFGKFVSVWIGGEISDRVGRKKLMIGGAALYIICFLGFLFTKSALVASVCGFASGVATSGFWDASGYPAVQEAYPAAPGSALIGIKFFVSVSGMIYPFMVVHNANSGNWKLNVIIPLVMSVVCLVLAIIAPFVCNLSLATSSTPTNSSTYTGCALTETDVQHYCKKAVPIQTVTNAIVVLTAVLFHVLKL